MLTVRPAQLSDLAALCAIRYAEQPAIHRDRIAASDGRTYAYLVAAYEGRIVGFGVLLIERPPQWSDALEAFPIVVDLFVAEASRGQGIGRSLLRHMEALARQRGMATLSLSVEPRANPRALSLYTRLGFRPLQAEPYRNVWRFRDSDGVEHSSEEWVIDMVKSLEG